MSSFPQFYNSQAWKKTCKAYLHSKGNLCERCLMKGMIVPAQIVHHKVYLTAENIEVPEVALNWANLECLCKSCHELEHSKVKKRYTVDEMGRVIARD